MAKQKIGIVFIITIIALGGIGASLAGFSDTINILGNIFTAYVSLEVVDYSIAWVWKIWDDGITDEIYITNDPDDIPDQYPNYVLVSSAVAQEYNCFKLY